MKPGADLIQPLCRRDGHSRPGCQGGNPKSPSSKYRVPHGASRYNRARGLVSRRSPPGPAGPQGRAAPWAPAATSARCRVIIGLAFRHRTASFQSKEMMQPASTPDNESKLLKAVQDNDKTTAVALLKAGTNVNCRDEAEWAPLHHAAYENRLEVAQVLLAHGADVNARTEAGSAPLHYAAAKNSLEVAQVLLAHGADVNARNWFEEAPLHKANSLEVAQVLLAHGADVNARDRDGDTPVAWAKRFGYPEVEALLRQHGGH